MRVVVTGAGGIVGACVVQALARQNEVTEVVGLVHRPPKPVPEKTRWLTADLLTATLEPIFARADAVIHLAWTVQPTRDAASLEKVNVDGSCRVFEAAAAAGVRKLVYASSVSAYAPGPRDELVDETWPIGGIESSTYSRQKVAVEGQLDVLEHQLPDTKIVRMRPAAVFGGGANGGRHLLRDSLLLDLISRGNLVPAIPLQDGLCFQAVHSSDLALAYALAATRDVEGAFNLAADPLLDGERLSAAIGKRRVSLPRWLARLSWRTRLRPNPPDWLDLARELPLVSSERAVRELGWEPRVRATEALAELLGRQHNGHRANGGRPRRSTDARQRVLRCLANAGTIERQGIVQLRRAVERADQGPTEIFATHLAETETQERRVRERLEALGADPDDPALQAGGAAVDAFAASQPQGPARLTALAFAYQHLEIAAYESLREAADAVGDVRTAALATELLAEERAMADRLASGFDAVVEASLNGGGESAEVLLDRYLVSAHSIEREGLHLLETAPRIVTDPALRQIFGEHLRESEEHEVIVRERLDARGVGTARAEDAVLRLVGNQVGTCLATQPDTEARLIGFARAYDHLEIAAYELLVRAARRAGDDKVLAAAERILAEERAAAARLGDRGGSG